jgi:hypothetical protein
MIPVPNSCPAEVFSFVRQNEKDKVFAVFNFSALPHSVSFHETLYYGNYVDYMSGESVNLDTDTQLDLEPWGFRIFEK